MLSALALRIGGALPVLLFVICALFGLIKLAPGDAATLLAPDDAGPAEVARLLDNIAQWRMDALSVVLQHVFLPAVTSALGMLGIIARITRSAVIDVGQEDFILTAVFQ